MAEAQHRGDSLGVQAPLFEGFHNGDAGVQLIVLVQLLLGQVAGAGDAAVEIVGMGGAVAGQIFTGLGPGDSIGAVGMDDTAHLGEGVVEHHVGLGVGGGIQLALHLVALQVHNHHVAGGELIVIHAAGLDDKQALLPVDAGDIAPGIGDQPPFGQLHIGKIYFLFQFFQHDYRPSTAAFSMGKARR